MSMASPKGTPSRPRALSALITLSIIFGSLFIAYVINHLISEKEKVTEQTIKQQLELPQYTHINPSIHQTSTTEKASHDNKTLHYLIKPGDNISSLFQQAGLNSKELALLLKSASFAVQLHQLHPSQTIQITINKDRQKLIKLVYSISPTRALIFTRSGEKFTGTIEHIYAKKRTHYVTATIKKNLYKAGARKHIPLPLLQQLSTIFSNSIDFAKDIRAGAQFTLLYEVAYINDNPISSGTILAASVTNKGRNYQAIRFNYPDGSHDYFTPTGNSLKKAFDRYPIKYSHISSSFNLHRSHPVLNNIVRPHKGIDLAANIGTPIHAVSDGNITFIGKNHGYGNMIKIKHSRRYSTLYAHMHRFKSGIYKGSYIKKGQLIGYVGQTGLASGPHCHFEFHDNKVAVNPATVKLPDSRPIAPKYLAQFLAKARQVVAHLELYQAAKLASNDQD